MEVIVTRGASSRTVRSRRPSVELGVLVEELESRPSKLRDQQVRSSLLREFERGKESHRYRIVCMLEQLDSEKPYKQLFSDALRDKSPLVRAAALESLAHVSPKGAIQKARPMLVDPSGLVRAEAVDVFLKTNEPLPIARIRQLVRDKDPLVRFKAVLAARLSADSNKAASDLLQEREALERDAGIKALIHEALHSLDGSNRHLLKLIAIAQAPSAGGRWQSFRVLKELWPTWSKHIAATIATTRMGKSLLGALKRNLTPEEWTRASKRPR